MAVGEIVAMPTISIGLTPEELNQYPINILLKELVLKIFSHLNLGALGTICCVSKDWKQLANEPTLWKIVVYRDIAFGNDKWAKYFGADVVKNEDNKEEFSSLPLNDFIEDCKKFKKIFPKKNTKDILMLVRLPKTLNGQFNLKNLGQLADKYFPKPDSYFKYPDYENPGYGFFPQDLFKKLGNNSIDTSCWVLMTKDILPESQDKTCAEQQEIVADLAKKSLLIGYEIPGILESFACIFSQYFDSKTRLFPDDYMRCKEQIDREDKPKFCISIGNFDYPPDVFCQYADCTISGITVLRKFTSAHKVEVH